MAKWSKAQIAVMARAVGWGARSEDAAEVAMAESGGDDKIVNSIKCVGLMQINQPVHVGAHPTWTIKWLQNPMNNLRAALVLYRAAGNKWDGPWLDSRDKGGGGGWGGKVSGSSGGTGTSQAGDSFGDNPLEDFWNDLLGEPERGPGSEGWDEDPFDLNDQLGITGVREIAAQLGRLAQALAKGANWLGDTSNWVRVAYVAGGALLALTAVNIIAKPPVESAVRTVSGTLPAKAVKTIARKTRGK
ncbi:transglycosylase SLT domain-containing protein [Streptomyces sp. NPDC054844]